MRSLADTDSSSVSSKLILIIENADTNIDVELEMNVAIFDILGSKSVHNLTTRILAKLSIQLRATENIELIIPTPIRHDKDSLKIRSISHSQSRL